MKIFPGRVRLFVVSFCLLFSVAAFAVDTDGDGVDDSIDAFPNDRFGAVDTDGDGKPNSFLLAQPEGFDQTPGSLPAGWSLNTALSWFAASVTTKVGPPAAHSGVRYAEMTRGNFNPFGSFHPTVFETAITPTGSYISFWYRGASAASTCLDVYIDGTLVTDNISLTTSWLQHTFILSSGSHTLRWDNWCTVNAHIDDVDFGFGSSALILDMDDDNDGVLDTADRFPLNPAEWTDTDNDGTGNNADTDDDNDLMPDTWETTYGFNPLVNDASLDADNDGLTNGQEFTNGSNPTINSVKNDYNHDGIAGWIWKGISIGNETASQNWQLTFPLYSSNWAVPNRFYHPVFPDQLNWEIVTSGDFNKDGDADILWRNTSTAEWKVWQMQNGLRVAQNSPADFDLVHAWQVIGAGDTDKDGDDDVILNNSTTGEVLIWQMQDHAVANTHNLGSATPYLVNRIGDFDKDGDVDLLFRETGGDILATWEIENNTYVAAHALANTGTNYNPVCAGDFDNDGDDDIMLVNSATTQEKWFVMESFVRSQVVGSTNVGFVFQGCGDYDGDGDADILWQRLSDDANRVILQQNYGASKQTVYTNAFGAVNGFVYRGNSN